MNVTQEGTILFRGECTDTLRRRITELETECKKLTMDIKLKEDQIRELELKVQVRIKTVGLCLPQCRLASADFCNGTFNIQWQVDCDELQSQWLKKSFIIS